MNDEQFEQEVRCKRCSQVLGYAPYWRTDYLCVQCNGPVYRFRCNVCPYVKEAANQAEIPEEECPNCGEAVGLRSVATPRAGAKVWHVKGEVH